jgi:hypothetical protein
MREAVDGNQVLFASIVREVGTVLPKLSVSPKQRTRTRHWG